MKICTFLICFMLVFNQLLLSQDEAESVISGVIKNYNKPSLVINEQSVELKTGGQFTYQIALKKPAYIKIEYDKYFNLYLRPGEKIKVTIDAGEDIRSVQLSGGDVAINKFLIQEEYESAKITENFNQNFRDFVALDEDPYVQKINKIWLPFEQRFENFLSTSGITDRYFMSTQRAIILYSKAQILIRYPGWHRYFSENKNYHPSENYYQFIDQLDLNEAELLDIKEYTDFLHQYVGYKSEQLRKENEEFNQQNYGLFRSKFQVCLNTFDQPQVRMEMFYVYMKSLLGEYYHKNIDDLVAIFKQNCTNTDYLNTIDQMIANDQSIRDQCRIKIYKKIGDIELDVFIYMPDNLKAGEKRPVVAFFHGGGWECGKPEWGHMQCEHFASLGMVAVSFEYRLETQHGTTPLECISDGRSAIRWLRENAEELHIDPERIVASGFSAGGHISLCTVMIDGFDDPTDDLTISPAANALMLWVTPAKIYDGIKPRLKNRATVADIDPASHVQSGLPPMVFFQGTVDNMVPPQSVKDFVEAMKKMGNRCDLHMYEGQTHLGWGENNDDVMNKMDDFLASIGYLDTIKVNVR